MRTLYRNSRQVVKMSTNLHIDGLRFNLVSGESEVPGDGGDLRGHREPVSLCLGAYAHCAGVSILTVFVRRTTGEPAERAREQHQPPPSIAFL